MTDLATRRMRVGYDRTLERALWAMCIPVAIAMGFFAGAYVQQEYLAPPPVVYHTPPVRVEPTVYLSENCVELARTCYARKRSAKVSP